LRKGKGKGGLGFLWVILLIIFLSSDALRGLIGLVLGLGLLAAAFFIIRAVIKAVKEDSNPERRPADVSTKGVNQKKAEQERPAEQPAARPVTEKPVQPAQPPKPKYPPEVQAVVDEGERAHQELEHLYATIPNLSVKAKIRELIDVSDKIVEDAVNDPSDVPQIKKFLDYYLPTTIKILNAYDRMGAQGIEGENISGTMSSIEEMLDTAVDAYKKLLDNLFANQALDVETDIEVMNTLLKREGLAEGGSAAVAGFGKM
jgi:hypothetical protein